MTVLLAMFRIDLRGSAPAADRGLIRESMKLAAEDDVDAAELAKKAMRTRYPDRAADTWRVEKVEMIAR